MRGAGGGDRGGAVELAAVGGGGSGAGRAQQVPDGDDERQADHADRGAQEARRVAARG